MDRNVVTSRVKPQLVRKRLQVRVPQTVKIVVRPKEAKAVNLNEIRKKPAPQIVEPAPAPAAEPAAPKPALSAVSRQQLIKQRRGKRTPKVQYITRDINPESAERIVRLRGKGKGRLLVIVGNGPSILEAPLEKLRNHPRVDTLAINKPDSRLWPTTYWAFFDLSQLRRHEDLWNSYNGWLFNSTAIKRQKSTSIQFKNMGGKGWSRDLLKGLHIGRSSVFASMQIAMWMQFEHIYIFGCDMNPEGLNGQLHFYGQNPDVSPDVRKERFRKEAEYYDHAADIMTPDERLHFTFCSDYNPWPFVEKFGRLSHKLAVEQILQHAARL